MPFGNSDCWSNCRAAFGWTKNAQRRWHSTRECIETRTIQDAVDMEGCLDFPGARPAVRSVRSSRPQQCHSELLVDLVHR